MKCLIVAAGKGSRLRAKADVKPLALLCGKPLISWVFENALAGGVTEFVVVTGYGSEKLEPLLMQEGDRLNTKISPIYNAEFEKPNGLSVMAARHELSDAPFILTMCDHFVDPKIIRTMTKIKREKGATYLGVDRHLENQMVDLEDVTRVLDQEGNIIRIGKNIKSYNCFDTGVFNVDPTFFDAIDLSGQTSGDYSISGGMTILSKKGLAKTKDIGRNMWIDVDDPYAFAKAEQYIERNQEK